MQQQQPDTNPRNLQSNLKKQSAQLQNADTLQRPSVKPQKYDNPVNFANYDDDDKALQQLINGQIPSDQQVKPAFFLGADRNEKDPNFDFQAKQDLVDDETLKKIEDFKKKYQEMKQKAEDNERDLAYSQIKVEELVNKIKEIDNKKNEFRDQMFNETKQNQELRRKLAELEDDKIALEQQLETGFKPNKISKLKEVNLAKHKQLMEEKAKREREDMRRQMLVGVDFLGQKDEMKIYMASKKGICRAFWERTKLFVNKLIPLQKDVKAIGSRYDKSIEGYFMFFRFLVGTSLFVFLLYLGLLLRHIYTYNYPYSDMCTGTIPLPCLVYYSRFGLGEGFVYSCTLAVFVIIGVILCLYEWQQFDLMKRERELYEDRKIKFSKLFFNAWNWQMNNGYDARQLKSVVKNEIKLNVEEDIIKEVVKKRKRLEKTKLFVRRIITFAINILFMFGGWALIVLINLQINEIQNFVDNSKFVILQKIAAFVPSICLSLINAFIPAVTKVITNYEKWDFQSTLIKQQVWRIYLAKILNFGIFVVINVELLTGNPLFRNKTILTFNPTAYKCSEDQASSNIFKLLITEFVIKILTPLIITVVRYLVFGILKGSMLWKPEFVLSDEIVWILYFQAITWTCLIFFPFITVISPIMLFLLFKYIYLILRKCKAKPKKTSNASDTGFFIMMFLNFTFIAISGTVICFLALPIPHSTWILDDSQNESYNCGPYTDDEYAQTPIQDMIYRNTVVTNIYNVIRFYPFLWLVGILLITLLFFKQNHSKLLKTYVVNKDQEYQLQIEELQKSIVKLQKKIDYNKMAQL